MKICIPTIDNEGLKSQISPHFERAPTYTIYETNTQTIDILQNTSDHMGGTCHPADLFAEKDITIMLCKGIGRGTLTKLNQLNITVYTGAIGQVKDVFDAYESKKLPQATKEIACTSHITHDCNCTHN
jgi:predicted Fe-Mo cluster-binding NifX family protein